MKLAQAPLILYSTAALAVAGVLAYLLFKGRDFNKGTAYADTGAVGTLGNATNQLLAGVPQLAGEAIGETVYSWFHPESTDADIYYAVLFPDASRHAIRGTNIDSDGYFSLDGVRYRIGYNSAGLRVAQRV